MRAIEPLPPHIVEAANRFRLGDQVEIDSTRNADWIGDWAGAKAEIMGVVVRERNDINVTIRHDGGQITDGFHPDDFRLVSRPERR